MFKTLVEKEFKMILQSPKFIATFVVSSLLILTSIFVGVKEYKAAMKQYESATHLNEQMLRESGSYGGLATQVHRTPDPMQIFVSGVQNDIGRLTQIESFSELKLTNSTYSDDPIFAVFRFLDLSFIVQIVLSLFAILFTYDAINGERESGTLKLVFSNAIARKDYILAKLAGSWCGLVLPLCIPILLGLLMMMFLDVDLSVFHWLKILALLGASLLFFTFFVVLGLFISAVTKNSATSFLFLLVAWITLVLLVPRASVMAAGQFVPVPSQAEIEGQRSAYAKQAWSNYEATLSDRWRERNIEMAGMSPDERQAYRDEHLWEWMEEDDNARKKIEKALHSFALKQQQGIRNRKSGLEQLAFRLSRFSPASTFQLAAMNLAGTNIDLKTRYEDALQNYRDAFIKYKDQKVKETGNSGGFRVMMDSERGFNISVGRSAGTLDLSDMPRFRNPTPSLKDSITPIILDVTVITLLTLLTFAGAFISFLRYDVR